ncbi:MAG: DNA-directed RNA polymerase subunit beta [Solibacillus sp.]
MSMNDLKGPPEPSIPKPSQRSRQQVQQELHQNTEEHTPKRVRLRLIPIWLRLLIVAILFVAVAVIGLMTGYSGIGGGEAGDALKWDTWQHLLDIIEGKE